MTYLIFAAYALGIFGHYLTRWSQGRTSSTFPEYMGEHVWHSLASVFSGFSVALGLVHTFPHDWTTVELAFTTAYSLDSMLNRDAGAATVEQRPAIFKKVPNESSDKSLQDRLTDDYDS